MAPPRPGFDERVPETPILQTVVKGIEELLGLPRIEVGQITVRAIVREENDQRVVIFVDFLEIVEDASDLLVQKVHHRRIDFHVTRGRLALS